MLRNLFSGVSSVCLCFLNEVLSLNAQEFVFGCVVCLFVFPQ